MRDTFCAVLVMTDSGGNSCERHVRAKPRGGVATDRPDRTALKIWRSTRWAWGVVVGLLVATPAVATPSTRLIYERGAGTERCPEEPVLRRAVEQRLGYDPFFPWADRTIVARIRVDARGLHGTVEMLDKSGIVQGSRELSAEAAQCTELVSGMALAISIAIDPSSVDRAAKPANGPEAELDEDAVEWSAARAGEATPAPAPAPATRDTAQRRDRTPASVRRSWVPELGAGIAGATALAPAPSLGPMANVGLRNGAWSIELEGRYLFGLDASLSGASVSSTLLEGALLGCWHAGVPFACLVGSAGRLSVSSTGIAHPRDDAAFVARLGPRLGADIPLLPALDLRVQADLLINLGAQSVEVDSRPAWNSSRIGGIAGIALRGRFP